MKKIVSIVVLLLLCFGHISAKSYTFAVLCDTRSDAEKCGKNGVNVSAVKAVCQDLKARGAEFVLAPGDFICGNVSWYQPAPPVLDSQYGTFLQTCAAFGIGLPKEKPHIPLYPIRGNHERYHDIVSLDSVRSAWQKNMGYAVPQNGPKGEVGYNYSFSYGGDLFIGTDQFLTASDKGKTGITVNQKWIDGLLKKSKGEVFVFGHTPAFAAHHQDCLADDPVKRDAFLRSIASRSGVYFCGHDHFYARAAAPYYKEDNQTIMGYIQQVITPSGAPFLTGNRSDNKKWSGVYSDSNAVAECFIDNAIGYQLVKVTDDSVTVQFIATFDGSSHQINNSGVYEYTYNTNWTQWDFAVRDQFSYRKKSRLEKVQSTKTKVIVDTDMGWDDVLSLLYLMKNPAVEIAAVTVTGCGETHLEAGVKLARQLMTLGKQKAVICRGTETPMALGHTFPKDFRNDMDTLMGLQSTLPKPTVAVDKRTAWQFLHDTLSTTKETFSILSLGGFTNLGKMLRENPFMDLSAVQCVTTMGGAVYVDGNIALLNNANPKWNQGPLYKSNGVAEWNMFVDPVAAQLVFESRLPIRLVPLDACDYVMLDKSYIETITGKDPIAQLAKAIFEKKTGSSSEGIPVPIFDPLATLVMTGAMRDYQEEQLSLVIDTVDTKVDNHCGQTVVTPGGKETSVVQGVSATMFAKEYLKVINSTITMKK